MDLHINQHPSISSTAQFFNYVLLMVFLSLNKGYAANAKKTCEPTELSLKNCPLQTNGAKFHFLEDKILIHDGVWRTIEKIPLIGKLTEWKDIKITQLGAHLYIQIWIWTEPKGDAEVQNLNWYVLQVNSRSLNLVFHESVQKRNRNLNYEKGHYFYDKAFPHELKLENAQPVIYFKNAKSTISKLKKSN